jgi:hypothetical protein
MTHALWDAVETTPNDGRAKSENKSAATVAANREKLDGDDPVSPALTCVDAVGRVGLEPTTYGLKESLRHIRRGPPPSVYAQNKGISRR